MEDEEPSTSSQVKWPSSQIETPKRPRVAQTSRRTSFPSTSRTALATSEHKLNHISECVRRRLVEKVATRRDGAGLKPVEVEHVVGQ